MPKFKPHKGLLKRCRVTKSGHVKVRVANGSHLRSGKTSDRLRSFRKARYVQSVGQLRRMTNLLGLRTRPAGRASEAPAE